MNMTLCKLVGW